MRRSKKRGGWPITRSLNKSEVKNLNEYFKYVSQQGRQLFISIHYRRSEQMSDFDRKRGIVRKIGNLSTLLKKAGETPNYVCLWEKPVDRNLHGHICLTLPKSKWPIIQNWVIRNEGVWENEKRDYKKRFNSEIHCCPFDHRYHRTYLIKSRRPCGPPEIDRQYGRREKQDPIRGRRVSYSKHAKDILAEIHAAQSSNCSTIETTSKSET